jgi:hypothetical protein
MPDAFHLLDLPSQALAVQRLLSGRPEREKLAWVGAHGRLIPVEVRVPGTRPVYRFESVLGLDCLFFIDGEEFVFIGDHTTYTVKG